MKGRFSLIIFHDADILGDEAHGGGERHTSHQNHRSLSGMTDEAARGRDSMIVPGLPGKPTQQFSGQDVSGERSRSGPGGMPLSHRQEEPGHPGNSGTQVAARATCVGPSCPDLYTPV